MMIGDPYFDEKCNVYGHDYVEGGCLYCHAEQP